MRIAVLRVAAAAALAVSAAVALDGPAAGLPEPTPSSTPAHDDHEPTPQQSPPYAEVPQCTPGYTCSSTHGDTPAD